MDTAPSGQRGFHSNIRCLNQDRARVLACSSGQPRGQSEVAIREVLVLQILCQESCPSLGFGRAHACTRVLADAAGPARGPVGCRTECCSLIGVPVVLPER